VIGDPQATSDPVGSGIVLALALVFFALGAGLLAIQGVSLSGLHAFAAFVTLAIVAAANQLIPVLGGSPPASARSVIGFSLPLALGFALLILALAGAPTGGAAALLLAVGGLAWAVWTLSRLLAGKLEARTRVAFAVAVTAFALAVVLGATMASELNANANLAVLRFAPAHGLLAIVAFASTLIVAVSYRLVPMFALAHIDEEGRWTRLPQWLVAGSGFVAAAATIQGSTPVLAAALLVGLAALIFAARSHVIVLRTRLRRRLDVSLRYAIAGWAFGALALVLAVAAALGESQATVPAVDCAVLGWLSLTILGYSYKIAGFLAWQHARAHHAGIKLAPLAASLPERPAIASLVALSVGVAASALAVGWAPELARIAFVLYALGAFGALATLLRLLSHYLYLRPPWKNDTSSGSTTAASSLPSP
jgi:hypothetical protein